MTRAALARAASTGAAVFFLAWLFSMELRQAALLAALSGATAWVLERART